MGDGVDFLVHQRFDLMAAGIADDDQADIVADEGGQFLVLQNGRCRLEDRGFVRIVDVAFDFVARLGAQVAHQAVEDAERIEIMALLRNLVGEGLAERLPGILDDLHRVRHDEPADAGAADDHKLERLVQDLHMAAHGDVTADDAAECQEKADDDVHVFVRQDRSFHDHSYGFCLA